MSTTYAIAKRAYDNESALYVTSIKRGGLSLDNNRIWDDRLVKLHCLSAHMRLWPTQAAADKALHQLATVGGYDDYRVVGIDVATREFKA